MARERLDRGGKVRYTSGTTPTKYQYTGQYSNATEFGLMFYNARWYDPALGRFTTADTVVPGGVQGYDRYAYANNDPVNLTDPSGHYGKCRDGFSDAKCRRVIPNHIRREQEDAARAARQAALKALAWQMLLRGLMQQRKDAALEQALYGAMGSAESMAPGGGKPLFDIAPPPPKTIAQRIVGTLIGGAMVGMGLAVTGLGAYLIVTGLAETATLVGAFLGMHQIPVGVVVGLIGLVITAGGGYIVYDSIWKP